MTLGTMQDPHRCSDLKVATKYAANDRHTIYAVIPKNGFLDLHLVDPDGRSERIVRRWTVAMWKRHCAKKASVS